MSMHVAPLVPQTPDLLLLRWPFTVVTCALHSLILSHTKPSPSNPGKHLHTYPRLFALVTAAGTHSAKSAHACWPRVHALASPSCSSEKGSTTPPQHKKKSGSTMHTR